MYGGTVITVPYMGVSGFALIRRLSVVRTAERHGGRSLHWVFADSPRCCGDRWGVLRNGTGAVPYIGGCADSPGILGNRWGVLRNGTGAVPYIGRCTDSPGVRWGSGAVLRNGHNRSLHWGSPLSYTSLNAQGNDPTYSGTTTAAPITVWVCIGCRKTVQPELHR